MRKCRRGVGMSDAMMPTKSLFMYPGYRSVVVLAHITVDTCIAYGGALTTEHITLRYSDRSIHTQHPYQVVDLLECRLWDVEAVGCNAPQRCVVQNNLQTA